MTRAELDRGHFLLRVDSGAERGPDGSSSGPGSRPELRATPVWLKTDRRRPRQDGARKSPYVRPADKMAP